VIWVLVSGAFAAGFEPVGALAQSTDLVVREGVAHMLLFGSAGQFGVLFGAAASSIVAVKMLRRRYPD
jgi:hypothetical protein